MTLSAQIDYQQEEYGSSVKNQDTLERAWNCDQWPGWLHIVVDATNKVADEQDMSTEQAIAYGILSSSAVTVAKIEQARNEITEIANERDLAIAQKEFWRAADANSVSRAETAEAQVADLKRSLSELQEKLERAPDPTHFTLLAEALAEITATVNGQSNQPIADIISGCLEEILALPNRKRALNSGASQNG